LILCAGVTILLDHVICQCIPPNLALLVQLRWFSSLRSPPKLTDKDKGSK